MTNQRKRSLESKLGSTAAGVTVSRRALHVRNTPARVGGAWMQPHSTSTTLLLAAHHHNRGREHRLGPSQFTTCHRGLRGDPMNSTTVIANYTPTSIPAEGWAKVADFVRNNVAQVLPADSTSDVTRRYLRALARLAYEQHVIGGRDLTVADLLADHVIEAYVVTNLAGHSNHVRGATRGALRTLGREINPDWEGDNGATKFGSDSVTEPYNETELDDVREFPNVQTNAERRQKAETILALGLGAGLRGGKTKRYRPVTLLLTSTVWSFVHPVTEEPRPGTCRCSRSGLTSLPKPLNVLANCPESRVLYWRRSDLLRHPVCFVSSCAVLTTLGFRSPLRLFVRRG